MQFRQLLLVFHRTFGQIIEAGLKCKARKCQIFSESFHYLGHVGRKGKIAADRSKLDRILEWPFPATGTDMVSLLGIWNNYRRLIPHCSVKAVSLYKHTTELRVFPTPELTDAFAKVKSDLCDSISLKLPNPEKPIVLQTDASSVAVVNVVKQMDGEQEVTTLVYSLPLNSALRNYLTFERELLAVVKTCDAFTEILLGRHYTLRTDHKALAAIFNSAMSESTRVTKWLLALQPFDIAIEVIAGKVNLVADSLSRIPWPLM